MSFFKKSDLKYTDYDWTALPEDNPKVRGPLDATLFNRHQGFEMLYFINAFGKTHQIEVVSAGQKVERMIRTGLPANVRSQDNVRQWVFDNWSNY